MHRRSALAALAATPFAAGVGPPTGHRVAPFTAEITVPIGHALMGGGVSPARRILDPLYAHGFAFLGEGPPLVVCVLDWCEVRNDAYRAWRAELARAAGTTPSRVLLTSVHQHDAPVADLAAEKLLRDAKAGASVCDPEFHARAVERTARALRASLRQPRRVTHVGVGEARAAQLASNRRYLGPKGEIRHDRTSATRNEYARSQPEHTIDPNVKVMALMNGPRPVVMLYTYAIHPMSYYGRGGVTSDFVGLARARRQKDVPGALHVYASGASGNVVAGKYNDGAEANRPVLGERLYKAMTAAADGLRAQPIASSFRTTEYSLAPRNDRGFTPAELRAAIRNHPRPFGRCLAALGLSWRERCDRGEKLDMPVWDIGPARLAVLPGEAYVELQLAAQKIAGGAFTMALGYGECGTGYVPTEQAVKERDGNLTDWCWVAPGAEAALLAVMRRVLPRQSGQSPKR